MKTSTPLLYLLILLLLCAQQGAAVHGISHAPDAAQQEQQLPHEQFVISAAHMRSCRARRSRDQRLRWLQ
ncbi:MAG: hypothetical protein ACR2FI_01600, partial [Burkholderiales bacterium]